MAVIKADQAPATVSTFSMADIEKQAKLVLQGAKVRAERLLVAAQEEGEQIKREAHTQALAEVRRAGIAEGLELGRKQGRGEALAGQREELAELVGAMTQAVQELDGARLALEAESKTAVIRLAIAIAERVTKRLGVVDAEVAVANVEEALRLVVHSADVRIAVHPSQRATLTDVLPRIRAKWPAMKHVDLVEDGSIAPGGCRIYSGGGEVNADLDLQLARIAEELVPGPNDPTA
jgi:flagellar assembly protein FliH